MTLFADHESLLVAVVVGGLGYALFGDVWALWGLWIGYSCAMTWSVFVPVATDPPVSAEEFASYFASSPEVRSA